MESTHLNARKRLYQLLPFILSVAGLLLMADLSSDPLPTQDLNAYQRSLQQQLAPKVHIGDWVVRAGTGHESQLIQQLSGNPYSHIGVISQTQPEIRVIHATTTDDHQRLNQVISSSLAEFTQSKWATTWAVYRHTGNAATASSQQGGRIGWAPRLAGNVSELGLWTTQESPPTKLRYRGGQVV